MAGPGLEDAGRHATEGRLAESHRDREVAEEPRRRRHPEGVRESLLQDDAESPGSVSFRVVPAESTTYPDLFRIPTFPRLASSVVLARTANAMMQLAGGLTAGFGPRVALLASAAFFVAAALPMVGLTEPVARGGTTSVVGDAREGLVYVVVRNASLRGLAIVIGLVNAGFGILIVALPVMIFQRVHGDAALVGEVWALLGLGSALSVIYFGRHSSEGRERVMLGLGTLAGALGMAVLAVTGNVIAVAAAMAFMGIANGPADIALFSMRQRRTDPAWYGRAFAVSMSLNFAGTPLGSAISGPLIHLGLGSAIGVSAGFLLIAALLVPLVIPAEDAGTMVPESARQSRRDRPVEGSPSSTEQGAG